MNQKLYKMNSNQEIIMQNLLGLNQRMTTAETTQKQSNEEIFKTINDKHDDIINALSGFSQRMDNMEENVKLYAMC